MLVKLYTVREAAERSSIKERTLRRAIRDGRLRVVRPVGLRRAVRVPEDALLEFLGLDAAADSTAVPAWSTCSQVSNRPAREALSRQRRRLPGERKG